MGAVRILCSAGAASQRLIQDGIAIGPLNVTGDWAGATYQPLVSSVVWNLFSPV
jgi:hypothetical protein